jgi:hypothetical protein
MEDKIKSYLLKELKRAIRKIEDIDLYSKQSLETRTANQKSLQDCYNILTRLYENLNGGE